MRADFSGFHLVGEVAEKLLLGLIKSADRYYLQHHLRQLEIPNRTRLYNAFKWTWPTPDAVIQQNAVQEILHSSTIANWAGFYCDFYPLPRFLEICDQSGVDLVGYNLPIIGDRNRGN